MYMHRVVQQSELQVYLPQPHQMLISFQNPVGLTVHPAVAVNLQLHVKRLATLYTL